MKKSVFSFLTLAFFWVSLLSCHVVNNMMKSPNGNILVNVVETADTKTVSLHVSYARAGAPQIRAIDFSQLGITMGDTNPHSFSLAGFQEGRREKIDYQMISGKRSHCSNEANTYIINLKDDYSNKLDVEVKVFNDGIAFRYVSKMSGKISVGPESTVFEVPDGHSRWISEWDWNQAYESLYPRTSSAEAKHYQLPALIQSDTKCFVLVTEAGVERHNSAASIYGQEGKSSAYTIRPDENAIAVENFTSPWRVAIIGSLSDIVESTIVTDLAPENRIGDISWIKPGVVSWIYWAYNHGSKDFQIVKQYIDMAAKLNLPYVLIDAEWDEMQNGGSIKDAIEYADKLGVGCLIWYNSSTAWVSNGAPGPFYRLNKPEDREREFAWLEKMGVKGVKIDFFKGDLQETMEYCIDLLESAAKHHLMVNFHGATLPRGWQRTYPNLLSTEAVRGAEWYNNGPQFTEPAACHNATLPFTRNVVGPMDYTPCTFSDSQFPHITTHAHELSLTVLFESALQHLADKPESYYAQPKEVQDFFSQLPSTWDDTKLLEGYPGDYVVLARRKGNKWYIGCANGSSIDRFVTIDPSVLGGKIKGVQLFEDDDPASHTWRISNPHNISNPIKCYPRGGFVMVVDVK